MTQMIADTRTVGTTRPFDGFDKLTAGRLRMTLSGVEWVRAPSPSTPLGTLSLSNG
jgi:hypothetical protein